MLRLGVHTESILVGKGTRTMRTPKHGVSSRLGGWTVDTVEAPVTLTPNLTSIEDAATPEGEDSKI